MKENMKKTQIEMPSSSDSSDEDENEEEVKGD